MQQLNKLEITKKSNKHPTFTCLGAINSNQLSILQLRLVAATLFDPPLSSTVMKNKSALAKQVGMELGTASANAKAASETAVIVASARAEDFAKYFLTFLRETNDTFEDWDVEFRAMRVLYGLENYINHQNNDHTLCAKWLWWTKCALGAKYDVPDLHYLTQVCVFL